MAEIYVAEGYLESCLGWQELISAQPTPDAQDAAGDEAQRKLAKETPHGVRKIIVRGEEALFAPDGSDPDAEQIWPLVRFSGIATRGWLDAPSLIRSGDDLSLAWPILNPSVIRLEDEVGSLPDAMDRQADENGFMITLHERLRRTLHFPVRFIEATMPYDDRLIIPSAIPTD